MPNTLNAENPIAASERTVRPAKNIVGALRLPGDKSISHRYAILAALAEGRTRLRNFSTGADCASTLECVEQLGARISRPREAGGEIEIEGRAGRLRQPSKALDCGNSGSSMRMLSGLLAAQEGEFTLLGDSSLNRRPMERVRKPLSEMGAAIALTGDHAPLTIRGAPLRGISFRTPIPSAQVKTSILFAGLQARGTTTVREEVRTRDHGERALRAFGAEIHRGEDFVEISGGQSLHGIEAVLPGDLSSAAFFLCAASLFPHSRLVLEQIGINTTRTAVLDVLTALGARVSVDKAKEHHGEVAATLRLTAPPDALGSADISGGMTPGLIDELPVLAAIAPFTGGGFRIRGARELRVKESDRIALVARNLRAMGARVEEFEDGLDIPGGQKLHGAEIDSGADHRIAMAFSIAALRAEGDTLIRGADAVAISFPEFFDLLDRVAER